MDKQEFFERYIVKRLAPEKIRNLFYTEQTAPSITLDDWRASRAALFKIAINRLPVRQRYIIQKIYFDDASEVILARELKISRQRVNKIHQKAIKRLYKAPILAFFKRIF